MSDPMLVVQSLYKSGLPECQLVFCQNKSLLDGVSVLQRSHLGSSSLLLHFKITRELCAREFVRDGWWNRLLVCVCVCVWCFEIIGLHHMRAHTVRPKLMNDRFFCLYVSVSYFLGVIYDEYEMKVDCFEGINCCILSV